MTCSTGSRRATGGCGDVPELPSGNGEAARDGESCDMGRVVGRPEEVIVTENGIGAKGGYQ